MEVIHFKADHKPYIGPVNLGYVCGLIDGEGWIVCKVMRKNNWNPWVSVDIGICQSTPQDKCLHETACFLSSLGVRSALYSARPNGPRRRPVSKLHIRGDRDDQLAFLKIISDGVIVKKSKCLDAISILEKYPLKRASVEVLEGAYYDYFTRGMPKRLIASEYRIAENTLDQFMLDNNLPVREHRQGERSPFQRRVDCDTISTIYRHHIAGGLAKIRSCTRHGMSPRVFYRFIKDNDLPVYDCRKRAVC